jgi:hypothetical protein
VQVSKTASPHPTHSACLSLCGVGRLAPTPRLVVCKGRTLSVRRVVDPPHQGLPRPRSSRRAILVCSLWVGGVGLAEGGRRDACSRGLRMRCLCVRWPQRGLFSLRCLLVCARRGPAWWRAAAVRLHHMSEYLLRLDPMMLASTGGTGADADVQHLRARCATAVPPLPRADPCPLAPTRFARAGEQPSGPWGTAASRGQWVLCPVRRTARARQLPPLSPRSRLCVWWGQPAVHAVTRVPPPIPHFRACVCAQRRGVGRAADPRQRRGGQGAGGGRHCCGAGGGHHCSVPGAAG